MSTIVLHYAWTFFNLNLLNEFEWWCKCKGNVKSRVTKNINNLTTYVQALKDFADFVENYGIFLTPWTTLICFHMSGGILLELVDAPITHHILAQMCFTLSC